MKENGRNRTKGSTKDSDRDGPMTFPCVKTNKHKPYLYAPSLSADNRAACDGAVAAPRAHVRNGAAVARIAADKVDHDTVQARRAAAAEDAVAPLERELLHASAPCCRSGAGSGGAVQPQSQQRAVHVPMGSSLRLHLYLLGSRRSPIQWQHLTSRIALRHL
jgi:hypothetical protein